MERTRQKPRQVGIRRQRPSQFARNKPGSPLFAAARRPPDRPARTRQERHQVLGSFRVLQRDDARRGEVAAAQGRHYRRAVPRRRRQPLDGVARRRHNVQLPADIQHVPQVRRQIAPAEQDHAGARPPELRAAGQDGGAAAVEQGQPVQGQPGVRARAADGVGPPGARGRRPVLPVPARAQKVGRFRHRVSFVLGTFLSVFGLGKIL